MAIEPPSTSLIHLLQSLNLATAKDLRACQTHLRHLVRDLPAFDSVWIDALVQGEKLTPFQAKYLVQSPKSLKLGSHVLVDRLPHDNWPVRYRAQPLAGGPPVAIAVLPVHELDREGALQRFQKHVSSVLGLTHRNLCLVSHVEEDTRSLLAISPLPIGEPLDELIVRRGRFPANIVHEIARQALDGLCHIEQAGTIHGDLRLRNLLLGPAGRIVLINAGLLAAVHPHVTIHSQLPIACHEGIAPELIGGRTERTSASEMYALGCLLWQLLAGRRPYLTADRIEQLAAHQSCSIAEIRTIAPDTPPALALLISRLVAKQPSDRFASLAAASRECGSSVARGRAQLSQFQCSFQSMVPIRLGRSTQTRQRATIQSWLTAAVLLGAAALFLFPGAGRSFLESAGRRLHATQEIDTAEQATTNAQSPSSERAMVGSTLALKTASLPESQPRSQSSWPTPQETAKHTGQIVLNQVGPYAASAYSAVGEMRISGTGGLRPVIEVNDQPLRLAGQRVVLENLIIRRGPNAALGIPLIEIDSQILIIKGCELQSGPLLSENDLELRTDPARVAIRWQHLDPNGIQPGEIQLSGCLIVGGAAAVSCDSVPQALQIHDTACLGTGPLCEILHAPGVRTLRIDLTRTTLRRTGPLLRQHQITPEKQTHVVMDLRQSILDLRSEFAMIEAIGSIRTQWRPDLKIESIGSYLAGDSIYAGTRAELGDEINPLDPSDLDCEGLLPAEIEFSGPLSHRWSNNVVTRYTAAVQSDEIPGIKPLPVSVRSPALPVPERVSLRPTSSPGNP